MNVKPMNNAGARWACVAVVWIASMPHLVVGEDYDPTCGGAGDELIVGPDQQYVLTWDETCRRVTIGPGGILTTGSYTLTVTELLTIDLGARLEVGLGKVDIQSDGPHTISGAVMLTTFGSTLRISCCAHARLTGAGGIAGYTSGAKIIIDCGSSLTNDTMIHGTLTIDATNGSFINGYGGSDLGQVLANAPGMLDIVGTNVSDVPNTTSVSPRVFRWGVDTVGSAVLQFNQDLLCCDDDPGTADEGTELLGHFYVGAGTLRIGISSSDIDVETTGHLLQTGGRIEAGADDSISFNVPTCPE